MLFRQLFDCESCTYTYLLASGVGREALLIDPVKERLPLYLSLLKELELKLVVAVDTHTHADHITATGSLREATQCAILMGEQTKAECVSYKVVEDETVDIDGLSLRSLYTPGHTDDSYSFVMADRVFTGDCLLIRATGRTDFQNGDPHASYDSIFNKLLGLPSETLVYPAHNYTGMTVSTIAEEKQHNPRLQVSSVEEYVEIMNNLNLAKPRRIEEAIPANLNCGLI